MRHVACRSDLYLQKHRADCDPAASRTWSSYLALVRGYLPMQSRSILRFRAADCCQVSGIWTG
jgi:hypothetical protein